MLLYPRVMEGNGSSTPILSLLRSRSEAVHRLGRSGTAAATGRYRSEIGGAAAPQEKTRLQVWGRSRDLGR